MACSLADSSLFGSSAGGSKSCDAYRIGRGGAGTGSKAFLACSNSPEKRSSYGDVAKGSSEGCDDRAGVSEDRAALEGGVVDEGAGLAFIQAGALTVGLGGSFDSFLN